MFYEPRLIDLSLRITTEMAARARQNERKALVGHLGTHIDTMGKEFPLKFMARPGIVFDVTEMWHDEKSGDIIDIGIEKAIDWRVGRGMFVGFYTGFIDQEPYGTERYYKEHPQLSKELIEFLAKKEVSLVAIDAAGLRRGSEHTPTDQFLADHGAFVIENCCNFGALFRNGDSDPCYASFTARTAPLNYAETSGIPCRVVAEI